MTISDAIPVQFWLNGIETFNEKEVPGIDNRLFYQPFECDDEIVLQFTDINALILNILDSDSEVLETIVLDETSPGVWGTTITPSDYGICNEKIRLSLSEYWIFNNPSNWLNDVAIPAIGAMSNFATKTSTQFTIGAGAVANFSAKLPVNIPSGVSEINTPISIGVVLIGSVIEVHFTLLFINSAGTIVSQSNTEILIATNSATLNFTTFTSFTGRADYMVLLVNFTSGSPSTLATTITVTPATVIYTGSEVAKSDCLDIKTSHFATKLMQYSNAVDFAGIDYSDSPLFGLRVMAKFFEERFPPENESESLSDGEVVKLSGSIKTQRQLEVDYGPPYMNKKVSLILQHNTIYIDQAYWTTEEAPTLKKLHDRSPWFLCKTWLTLKNSNFWTNVFGTERVIS